MNNTALFVVLIAGLVGLTMLFGGPPQGTQVSFVFKALPDLPAGFSYQAWVLGAKDALISLGRFRQVGDAKNFKFYSDLHRQRQFLISLETGDPDGVGDLNGPEPDLILFAGTISGVKDLVELALIAPDLATPSGGVYTLWTPTDNRSHSPSKLKAGVSANDANDAQGIWFVTFDPERSGLNPLAGLDLPRIPSENFVYEGWVHHAPSGTFASTGRFAEPGIADQNSGQSPYDGGRVHLGPSAPGEDFVNPGVALGPLELPLDLNAGTWRTAISIEPNSDRDQVPFVLVPWSAPIGTQTACLYGTVTAQPNPKAYQQKRCAFDPQYDGVAVIH